MSSTRKPKPPDKGAPPEHKPSRKVALEEVMRSLQDLVSNELATEPAQQSGGAAAPKKRRRTDQTRSAARADDPPATAMDGGSAGREAIPTGINAGAVFRPTVNDVEEVESITLETLPVSAPENPATPAPVSSAKMPLPAGGLQQELPYLDSERSLSHSPPESAPESAAPPPAPAAIPAPVAETVLTLSEENWEDIPVLEEAVDLSEEIDAEAAGHGTPSPPTALPPAAAARRLAIQVAARLNVELRKSGQTGLNSAIITQLAKMLEEALVKGTATMENTPVNEASVTDGGRSGLLPSRGITPSMEGRSAGREAVSEGSLIHRTNAGAVSRPPSKKH